MADVGLQADEDGWYPGLPETFEAPDVLKPYHPNKLSDKHKLAVSLLAAHVPIEVIEQVVGLGRGRINQIKTHPEAQALRDQITTEVVREITSETAKVIQGAALEAALKQIDLMRHAKNENVQRLASVDILDRAGFKPKEVVLQGTVIVPAEEMTLLREAMRECVAEIPPYKQLENSTSWLEDGNEELLRDELPSPMPLDEQDVDAGAA